MVILAYKGIESSIQRTFVHHEILKVETKFGAFALDSKKREEIVSDFSMLLHLALMAAAAVLPRVHALSSSLQQVTDFVSTPTNAKMYVYIPTSKVATPPIIVAIHHCDGTGPSYFGETQGYAQNADRYGYIVIYPSSPISGGCWDVSSTASLTHNGGGDSQTIANMVKYAETHYGGDINRVYMTGSSSGAMMTNVLAGAYPDIFKAGTLYGGVPDGCFYVAGATPGTTPAWNGQCSGGNLIKTAQQWGDQARSYYPGYSGSRPRMLMYVSILACPGDFFNILF